MKSLIVFGILITMLSSCSSRRSAENSNTQLASSRPETVSIDNANATQNQQSLRERSLPATHLDSHFARHVRRFSDQRIRRLHKAYRFAVELIDENGNVVSATPVSGHPLLQGSAAAAARQSKFSPTTLSGQPVKVTGIIVYNFVAQ